MEYTVEQLEDFADWLMNLRDVTLRATVVRRLRLIQHGNFGDHRAVGDGVSELRIHIGPGHRLYYTIRNRKVVFLLCAGEKSTQRKDIQTAKELAKEV